MDAVLRWSDARASRRAAKLNGTAHMYDDHLNGADAHSCDDGLNGAAHGHPINGLANGHADHLNGAANGHAAHFNGGANSHAEHLNGAAQCAVHGDHLNGVAHHHDGEHGSARHRDVVDRRSSQGSVFSFQAIGQGLNDFCTCGNIRRKMPSYNPFARPLAPVRPKIMLLGDSLTQRSFLPGQWGARLAAHYDRTADVELRGYAGYNSTWIRALVPELLHVPVAPALVIMQMGTNDSVNPPPVHGHDASASRQHVPVAAYKANLTEIIRLIREHGDDNTRILLLTPPPIVDAKRRVFERADNGGREKGVLWADSLVRPYVEACKHVAKKEHVQLLDLYLEFKQAHAAHSDRTTRTRRAPPPSQPSHPAARSVALPG
jgi:lysophospholipase L1-like esterase